MRVAAIAARLRARRAIAALEFALLAPLLLLIAAGIVETALLVRAYDAVNRLTMEYAVSYASCTETSASACQTELAEYAAPASIGNIAPQLDASKVSLQMLQVQMTGSAATVVHSYPVGATVTPAQSVAALASIGPNQRGVIVSVSYIYTMLFFPDLMANFYGATRTIAYTVAQRKY